jgi:Tfp pilus assembly protein PilF
MAHYNLGVASLKVGDRATAQAEYRTLLTLDAARAAELLTRINK